jgi:hypothetical protein
MEVKRECLRKIGKKRKNGKTKKKKTLRKKNGRIQLVESTLVLFL